MWLVLLKLVGFGKAIIQGLINFVINHPLAATAIGLALILAATIYHDTKRINELNSQVTTQQAYIGSQTKSLNAYVLALKVEQQTVKDTISKHNQEVGALKNAADKALANSKAAQAEAEKTISKYDDLADKYAKGNYSVGTAEQRIAREEKTTDEFFKDYNGVK